MLVAVRICARASHRCVLAALDTVVTKGANFPAYGGGHTVSGGQKPCLSRRRCRELITAQMKVAFPSAARGLALSKPCWFH